MNKLPKLDSEESVRESAKRACRAYRLGLTCQMLKFGDPLGRHLLVTYEANSERACRGVIDLLQSTRAISVIHTRLVVLAGGELVVESLGLPSRRYVALHLADGEDVTGAAAYDDHIREIRRCLLRSRRRMRNAKKPDLPRYIVNRVST